MSYIGNELDLFAHASNWRDYWCQEVRGFLGGRVLEVGAGIGSATWALCDGEVDRWVALEPDPVLAERLREGAAARGKTLVETICGTIDAVPAGETFSAVLYIDVLEHIADDGAELHKACNRLEPGGHLIVLVPAHPFLFSEFDRAIGHFRRYDRAGLRSLRPAGCREVFIRYLDSVGLCASLGNRLLLHKPNPTTAQIALWDGRMVPVSRMLDPLLGHSLGKTLLAVWQRL